MTDSDVLCSDCGWTGDKSELVYIENKDDTQCPVCSDDVEFVE